MQDNSTDDITDLMIRYADNEVNADEKTAFENLLQQDKNLDERYQLLLTAKQAIRAQGLKQRVQGLHKQYLQEVEPVEKQEAKIIRPSFFKTFMRVAAVFILAVFGYGVFEYTTTDNQSLYNENFTQYQLPVNRGEGNTDMIDSLYSTQNYMAVISSAIAQSQSNQKDYFLAAQSYLKLNNTNKAIEFFEKIESINDTASQKYFADETDYYLALAYIKNNNIDKAEKQLDKITSDKQHLFYNKAKEISKTKLTVLKVESEVIQI